MTTATASQDDLRKKVHELTWYHNIDLGGGLITPGRSWQHLWEPSARFLEESDLCGKTVLEIGSWDGYFGFRAETLGAAAVMATDIKPWETFFLAREILGSKVEFRIASIYTLREQFEIESFDVVLCYGVYYHLLHPMLGFVNANHVLKPGGSLLLEGAYYRRHEQESLVYFSHGADNLMPHDPTYCTCPTLKALENMLHASHFEVARMNAYLEEAGETGRVLVEARKRQKTPDDLLYEDTYPNQLLKPWDD